MARKNYSAWSLSIDEFATLKSVRERLQFLIRFAVLAPSSHNSQPWKFFIGNSAITILPEESRRLPVSDSNGRQLFVSLGCAIQNLMVAGEYFGLNPICYYGGNGAIIAFHAIDNPGPSGDDRLCRAILSRSTNRNPYTGPVPESFLTRLSGMNSSRLKIFCTTDTGVKNTMADVTLDALQEAMADKKFRQELSQYVLNNLSAKPVGMPAFGLGVPTLPSFILPSILRYFNVHKLSRRKEEKLLKAQTPVFVVIATEKDNPEAWMNTGSVYQKIALMAEAEGIKTNILAAGIQIGNRHGVLSEALKTKLRPQVFFRMGLCDKTTPHSPRLRTEEVI